jgi:hypothetical protein
MLPAALQQGRHVPGPFKFRRIVNDDVIVADGSESPDGHGQPPLPASEPVAQYKPQDDKPN